VAYVYEHYKLSDGGVFYVGISLNSDGLYLRLNDKNKRSRFWKSIVSKHGFSAKVVSDNITFEEAKVIEVELVKKYGRLNNGSGCLCNLTDGGDGCAGFVITDEYRKKISEATKGKTCLYGEKNPFYGKTHSAESRKKISEALKKSDKNKGERNHNYGKKMSDELKKRMSDLRKGKKMPDETKEKIRMATAGRPKPKEWRERMSGSGNFYYGKGHLLSFSKNGNAKKCVHIETGVVYGCLKEACHLLKISYHTQRAYIHPLHKRHSRRKFNYINQ